MIKADIKKGEKLILQASGSMVEITAELTMMIDKIYESFKGSDPAAAKIFKEMLAATINSGPIMDNDPEETIEAIKKFGKIYGEER